MMLEVKDGVERGGPWIKNEASVLVQNHLEAKGGGRETLRPLSSISQRYLLLGKKDSFIQTV
jgi:hypothetical protein